MSPLEPVSATDPNREQPQPLPPPFAEPAGEDAAPPALIQLEGDFAPDGTFGRRILEVTALQVRVLEPNGAVSFQIPIDEVKSARNEPLVGGGQLEITTKTDEIVPVIAYSLTLAAKFSEAARGWSSLPKARNRASISSRSGCAAKNAIACCPKKTASVPPASTGARPWCASPGFLARTGNRRPAWPAWPC